MEAVFVVLFVIFILFLAVAIRLVIVFSQKPVPPEELSNYGSFIDVDGIKTHLWAEGTGEMGGKNKRPVLILIHSFAANNYIWRFNVKELGKKFRVFAIDLPGFGLSEKPKEYGYTLDDFGRFIISFMDEMKIDKATLVGNSMGGGVSVQTAVNHPERVNGLILIGSLGYHKTEFTLYKILARLYLGELLMLFLGRHIVKFVLKWKVYYNNDFITDDFLDYFVNTYRTKNSRRSPIWVFRGFNMDPTLKVETIKKVNVPTLIIWGDKDKMLPPAHAKHFHRTIKGSKLIFFPKTGHFPQDERSDEVNSLISDFVNKSIFKDKS
jgi:2-hydroxy-6-oxonona-2,4-dienedioate hydrolase